MPESGGRVPGQAEASARARPVPTTRAPLLRGAHAVGDLQRLVGNQAVGAFLARQSPATADRLPQGLRAGAERLAGVSLADVTVARGSPVPAALGAEALTRGPEIHLAPGHEEHLPHETWHAVQQRQGRVNPTAEVGGAEVSTDPALESEADAQGARAASDTGGPVAPPPPTGPPGAPGRGTLQFAGWKVDVLAARLTQMGLAGVCNALSAAWLADLIVPDTDEGTGVTRANFAHLIAFKQLLDAIVGRFGIDSERATLTFLRYFGVKDLDSDWLAGLTEATVAAEDFQAFLDWTNDNDDDGPELQEESHALDTTPYAQITHDSLAAVVDEALEANFKMEDDFNGLVIIKAEKDGSDDVVGHQMAVAYDHERHLFQIFDQTVGLIAREIRGDDEISENLARHLFDVYVTNPMAETVRASFRVTLLSAPAEEEDGGDEAEAVVADAEPQVVAAAQQAADVPDDGARVLASTTDVQDWVAEMGGRYDKAAALENVNDIVTWLKTTHNVRLTPSAASGLAYLI